jgi:hypothetical protein
LDIRAHLADSHRGDRVHTGPSRRVEIADVNCPHRRGLGRDGDEAQHHAVVFVRRGCFVRTVDGIEQLLDPTRAYCINPGQDQRYDHPHDHGDDCTAIRLRPGLLASLWGGDPTLPSAPLPSPPAVDLEHRLGPSRRSAPYSFTSRCLRLVGARSRARARDASDEEQLSPNEEQVSPDLLPTHPSWTASSMRKPLQQARIRGCSQRP